MNKRVLKKGDSYFIYGTKTIKGKKYYEVGDGMFIKAVNATKPFSTYYENNDVNNEANNEANNSSSTSTNTNSNTTTTNNNAQSTSNNSSSVATNQTTNGSSNTNSSAQNKPSNNGQSQANAGNNTQKPATKPEQKPSQPANKPAQQPTKPATQPENRALNEIRLPKGYVEATKGVNFAVTPENQKLGLQGTAMNRFHSESVIDDNMKIDSANLTPAQANEIGNFARRLMNQVRAQYGAKPLNYSDVSYKIAKRVAYLYEQDGMGLSTWHDQKALNQVDKESGITTAELMGGSPVNTKEDLLTTMTDLKHTVMDDITSMIFNQNELEHLHIMATYNSVDHPDTYLGVSVSWQQHNKQGLLEHSEHFILY